MRKICFVITSFIHYSRNLLVLEELKKRKDIDLHIIIGGTALLPRYSAKTAHIKELLTSDGHNNLYELHFNLEGNDTIVKAKTTGLGVIEFTTLFNHIKPDVVVVRGDRFEVLSAVVAATYMSIPVAHIEGGDLSGSIDESVRHAITKLAHIHFATNEPARKRILKLGERPEYVFNFGSPDVEVARKLAQKNRSLKINTTGGGARFDTSKGYLMVMYHPDISDIASVHTNTRKILKAVHNLNIPAIWFWPNADAGAEDISHELRMFKDEVKGHKIRFMRYLGPRDFIWLLQNSLCLVGNSSAGIKECSFLGLPVVNIGTRQNKRLSAGNVLTVGHNTVEITRAIRKQLHTQSYKPSDLYVAEHTSKNIARIIATIPLYTQKSFVD